MYIIDILIGVIVIVLIVLAGIKTAKSKNCNDCGNYHCPLKKGKKKDVK